MHNNNNYLILTKNTENEKYKIPHLYEVYYIKTIS